MEPVERVRNALNASGLDANLVLVAGATSNAGTVVDATVRTVDALNHRLR